MASNKRLEMSSLTDIQLKASLPVWEHNAALYSSLAARGRRELKKRKRQAQKLLDN